MKGRERRKRRIEMVGRKTKKETQIKQKRMKKITIEEKKAK